MTKTKIVEADDLSMITLKKTEELLLSTYYPLSYTTVYYLCKESSLIEEGAKRFLSL